MNALKFLGRFAAAAILLAVFTEGTASFFLPAPRIHKLPMIDFVADPVCGYRMKPAQQAYTLGSPASINKWGFRGNEWEIRKPADTVRIAVLGSSYAFGHGVSDEEMFTAELEDILNELSPSSGKRYEVMSFGAGGYDSGHEMKVLQEYALKFKPDIVITAFFFNDLFYIKDYAFYPEMFELQKKNFNRLKWELVNLFRRSRLAMYLWDEFNGEFAGRRPGEVNGAIDAYVLNGVLPPGGPNSEGWNFIASQMSLFRALADEHGFKPVFAIIPTHEEMLDAKAQNTYVDFLKKWADELGFPPLVLLDRFRETGEDLRNYLIPYDFHLSEKGHRFIAEALAEKITPYIAEMK